MLVSLAFKLKPSSQTRFAVNWVWSIRIVSAPSGCLLTQFPKARILLTTIIQSRLLVSIQICIVREVAAGPLRLSGADLNTNPMTNDRETPQALGTGGTRARCGREAARRRALCKPATSGRGSGGAPTQKSATRAGPRSRRRRTAGPGRGHNARALKPTQ